MLVLNQLSQFTTFKSVAAHSYLLEVFYLDFLFYFQKGELVFVNIAEKKCVHRSQVSGHLIRLEVVPDDRQHTTYLLVSV